MKWSKLTKGKKILLVTALAVGCVATVFASYMLKGTVGFVSSGSTDAEAFPVDIEVDTPAGGIGNVKPFLVIPGPGSTSANRPSIKSAKKSVPAETSGDSVSSVMPADNSDGLKEESVVLALQNEAFPEGYEGPSTKDSDGGTAEGGIFTSSADPSHISYRGDFEAGGGGISGAGNSTGSQKGHTDGRKNEDPDRASPVPEPSTMILLGTGLVGLAVYGKKRLKGH